MLTWLQTYLTTLSKKLRIVLFLISRYIGGNKSEGHFSLVNEAYSMYVWLYWYFCSFNRLWNTLWLARAY
jgi:hypothetical protein